MRKARTLKSPRAERTPVAANRAQNARRAKTAAQDAELHAGAPAAISVGDVAQSTQTTPGSDAPASARWLTIFGATHNNLKNIDAAFPLGRFIAVTGVSGSGKSSLVNDILYARLARDLNDAVSLQPGAHAGIAGADQLDKIIAIDQTPIGRTPRSNPATYIKLFDEIRDLYTRLPDSKLRGYRPGRFSFNVPAGPRGGGRCEACEGNGANRIEMDFLADVWVTCPVCEGRRFSRETLQVTYKGRSIADVLDMDVAQASEHFENVPRIRAMLQTLHDVGLDYLKIGQPSTTLSGGEAQRIKLARELVKRATGRTLYVLDEPTTGLHFEDVRRLLTVLHSFVDAGNTVVVIEHNLDVIKTADWVIDLGPEGGAAGGQIIAAGTPEQLADCPESHTGRALAEVLHPARPWAVSTRPAPIAMDANSGDSAGSLASSQDGSSNGGAPGAEDFVTVRGARQHNLKDVSTRFPRNRLSVCTGVSGSGKTSFAIDTVFTEGYRRYIESLSAYARQFLGQMAKPDVDHVDGLSPAICIEQHSAGNSPRSTVGTITEIYDYMRVLWARCAKPYCPACGGEVGSQTVDEITARILALGEGTPIILLAPVTLADGESYAGLMTRLKNSGYLRVRIDGEVRETAQAGALDARRRHRVEVIVDRTVVRARARSRITESIEHALALGNGILHVMIEPLELEDGAGGATAPAELRFSQRHSCAKCGESYEELTPHHFSFNSQMGWCETCEGLGVQRGAPAGAIIRHPSKSLFDGAIAGWSKILPASPMGGMLQALCQSLNVSPSTPLQDWTPAQRQALLYGTSGNWISAGDLFAAPGVKNAAPIRFHWRGFFPTIDAATRNSWQLRHQLHSVVTDIPCVTCRGGRLRADAAAARLTGMPIVDLCNQPLSDAAAFFDGLKLGAKERKIAGELLKEIRNRLTFLLDVGLEYLTLHRAAPTLSGGEAQRIRLASQIGSGLSGVLYVLDEPTIGLHPRDTGRLVRALTKLRDLGNTLLLVEHDREVIRAADHLLDFGPRAGSAGGQVVLEGPPSALPLAEQSLTRQYLTGATAIAVPANRRPVGAPADVPEPARRRRRDAASPAPDSESVEWLRIEGARQNNLRNLNVAIPLGRLVAVTGVSGSGKSSLVNDILWPAAARKLQLAQATIGEHDRIDGLQSLDKVINVDQSPIGATPASNPATYTGAFDWIRELFARVPEAKVRGYNANRFSFNRPGGRCDACEGNGQRRIAMHFMPDVWVECELCRGKRYNAETLEVRFKNRSIADVLNLSVQQALEVFNNVPRVRRILQTLSDVGLDYVRLGQPAPTLSGGEAQRVKLAAELAKPATGRTLYILDEPTTGLHFDDVAKLLEVLHRLVDLGNSVIVVEHNLDVIKSCDWVIDLGPEAGDGGGRLVVAGTPENVAAFADSHTGRALAQALADGPYVTRTRFDAGEQAARDLDAQRGGLGDVGRETRLPWEVDGKRWHLNRTARNGQPTRWDPKALEFIVETVQAAGDFLPTHWNERASVEITAEDAPVWFMHALTGGEWLLEAYFRVPTGSFNAVILNRQLGLKTLDERDDIGAFGSWPRVEVRQRADGFDAAVIYVHDRAEIDTPAFRKFIRAAAAAYRRCR